MMTRETAMALVDEMNEEAADIHFADWEAVEEARDNGDENAEHWQKRLAMLRQRHLL